MLTSEKERKTTKPLIALWKTKEEVKHKALLRSSPTNDGAHNGTQNHTTVHNNKIRNHVCIKQISTSESENNNQLKINSPSRPLKRKKKKCTKRFFFSFYYTESAISHQQRKLVIKVIGASCTGGTPMMQVQFFEKQNNKRPLHLNFTSWGGGYLISSLATLKRLKPALLVSTFLNKTQRRVSVAIN